MKTTNRDCKRLKLCLLRVLAIGAALSLSQLACAQDWSKKDNFHIKLPGAQDGNRTTATDVHITFYGPPTEVEAPGWTNQSVRGNTLSLWGGSLAPGNHFDLTALIKKERPAGGPIIERIDWTQSGTEVGESFLGYDADDKFGRKYLNGFNNYEYFDFSDPFNAEFVLPNFTAIDTYLDYLLNDFSLFLVTKSLELRPIFSASSIEVKAGDELRIPLGVIEAGSIATASIGTLTVFDQIDGTTDSYETPQRYSQTYRVPDYGSTFSLLTVSLLSLASVARWGKRKRFLASTDD